MLGSRIAVPGLVAFLLLVNCARVPFSGAQGSATDVGTLRGTWQLVTYVTWDSAGAPHQPLGTAPSGYAVFDATGRAFIQLMRPTDPASFAAYYGTYSVDLGTRILRIQVEGSNVPTYPATVQVRPFEIRQDTLVLGIAGQYQATLVRLPGR